MLDLLNATGFLSRHSTIGSDVSYIFAATFTLLFLLAGLLAIRGQGLKHHRLALFSTLVMFAYFAFYYKVRSLGVDSLSDQLDFRGPQWIYTDIFRPLLYLHFIAVSLSTFLVAYMVANGLRTAITHNRSMTLRRETLTPSKILWALGLIWLGFLLWWVFSVSRFDLNHRLMLVFLGYVFPAITMVIINRFLHNSERRHRILGRICILSLAILLMTSTIVYYLLYIAF